MKIGIMTIFQVPNYGSVLQAFATQYILEKMGHECMIINYRYPNEWHWQQGSKKTSWLKTFIRKYLLPSRKTMVLDDFRNSYFHLTRKYHDLDDMRREDWYSYDAFVSGSDQIWNARFTKGDTAFLLSFAPDGKKRYSIASSFAMKTLPEEFRDKYKKELEKFAAISVREQNGVGIVNAELGLNKPVEVVLDPTLLLSKEDWLKAIPRSSFRKKRPYILFYMWAYAFEPRPYIFEVTKQFQQKMNCDVIALEGYTKAENACGLVMENRSASTLPEFIDLFANADLVVTSSFHGTAFALDFGIPLISVIPENASDDRQTTLLKAVGADNNMASKETLITNINPNYNVKEEQDKLASIRKHCCKWIKSQIV